MLIYDPPDIDLHRHERRISLLDQHVIARARAIGKFLELAGVVVL